MGTTVTAGLAWAVPVEPDQLCAHLKAFKKCLPVLNALRLCHKFGTGEKVHISKVPLEILHAIEDCVLQQSLENGSGECYWLFKHYESRCEPFIDHCEDPSVLYDCKDDFRDELCDACKAGNDGKCEVECDEKVMELMNERCVSGETYDWRFEDCEPRRNEWEELIDSSEDGRFAKYNKLLRKHFGLEAVFVPTRKAAGKNAQWLEDPNHKWHDSDELKTTICCLTLPGRVSSRKTFEVGLIEGEVGLWTVEGAQSSFVQLPSLSGHEKRVQQFRKALRSLKLKPFIHPSQLKDTITTRGAGPETQIDKHTSEKMDASNNDDNNSRAVETMEWPQLIMLVESVNSSD